MTNFISEKVRVLIIDCNKFELATLADSLRMQGLDVVGEAIDLEGAQELFRALTPDTVILSLQNCDQSIVEMLHSFKLAAPSIGIVLLTDTPDLRLYGIRQNSLPQGTQIIEKSALSSLHEIRSAVEIANKPQVKTGWIANHWNSKLASLTDIQMETLRLLAMGLSNSDIGKSRFVSEKSVEQTITRIAQHLNVVHEKGRNMRVILATEYFRWTGAPNEHAV